MMKLLGFLTYTAFVLVVGALCAWLVRGKDDPNCTLVGVSSIETTDQRYIEELDTLQRNIKVVTDHNVQLYSDVSKLQQAYDSSYAARDLLKRELERVKALTTEEARVFQQEIIKLKDQIKTLENDKEQTKAALKQQRSDYIALANKNAALERASIEELAKAHKEGTKVSKRELPPIMQAVVNMGGVPSWKQVPRPVLP